MQLTEDELNKIELFNANIKIRKLELKNNELTQAVLERDLIIARYNRKTLENNLKTTIQEKTEYLNTISEKYDIPSNHWTYDDSGQIYTEDQ